MVLTGSALLPLTFGYVDAREEADGLAFSRFSAPQREAYAASLPCFSDLPSDYFANNCDTTAGVMLDFFTDARALTLEIGELRAVNGAEEQAVDLLVNHRLRATLRTAGQIKVSLRPSVGADGRLATRITICLPYFAHATIRALTPEGATYVTPAKKHGLWLCLGDSITHGCQASCPSRTYVARLARAVDYEILNQGSGGWVHHPAALAPLPDPRHGGTRQPDIVTVAYGINDLGRKSTEQNRADMLAFYEALLPLYPTARVFMISPLWTAPMRDPSHNEFFGGMYRLFDEVYAHLAVACPGRMTFIDGRRLMPYDVHYVRPDGVHPVDRGFRYYAERLRRVIQPYL